MAARHHHGVICGGVDVGEHQRSGKFGVDGGEVGAEAVCTVLAAGRLRGEAHLVNGGPGAGGCCDVHGVAGVEQGLV
ncbi:hypothetical protein D9M72_617470 [compost metagenome]